ncbi:helix-turn-helix transcriptional regulator [Streptomyces sp. 110]|uniref:Helix-turn-helix transcriptional regulator n=1 Tax=Streptomyces endocoffeicus TaxID=2898945 RepID=A0ABS1Q971_9ACTN|nr:helix-turn-helix transcriptional regulator [Streptomyces endocoffeicus]MBL1120461.1 helix-turn-helix transcriptional regulator [Streptomyces endocoffeicus]
MKGNLRPAAANRAIWKSGELRRMLADHGLRISAGKMPSLWSGEPAGIKLADLDIICAVLDRGIQELLIPEPHKARAPPERTGRPAPISKPGEGSSPE